MRETPMVVIAKGYRIVVVACCLLAACSGEAVETTATADAAAQDSPAASSESGRVTIRLPGFGSERISAALREPRGFGSELIEGAEPRTISDEDAFANLDMIQTCLEDVRELEFTRPLAVGFYDRGQFADHFAASFYDDIGREEFAAHARAWAALGFIPRNLDLAALTADSLAARLLGFYDSKLGRLQCLSGDFGAQSRMVMIHETVHALQDQRMDLHAFAISAEARRPADQYVARIAVMEGDASLATKEVLDACRGLFVRRADDDFAGMLKMLAQQAVLGAAMPPLLADGSGVLYQECENFVKAVREHGGWEAVNALYRDPPRSSEQILHPEKFLDPRLADEPVPLRAPDLAPYLGADWSTVYRNTLGEAGTRQLVRFTGDPWQAFRAAKGWGGDEYRLYEDENDESFLQWVSAWDSECDAVEMMTALQNVVRRQASEQQGITVQMDEAATELRLLDADGRLLELARREDAWVVWFRGLRPDLDTEAMAARCLP